MVEWTRIGEIFLSRSGRALTVHCQGGISAYILVADVHALLSGSIKRAPLRAKSYLGVDLEEAVLRIRKEKEKRKNAATHC